MKSARARSNQSLQVMHQLTDLPSYSISHGPYFFSILTMFSPFNLWRIVSSTRAGLRSRELTDPYAVPYTGNAPTVCLLVLHRLFFLIDCGSRLGPVHIAWYQCGRHCSTTRSYPRLCTRPKPVRECARYRYGGVIFVEES